jgi:glycosyltransferase involved in cell wall biosynthesis
MSLMHGGGQPTERAVVLPVEVSVLTPVFNAEPRHLEAFWASLEAQTFRAWELVLVDDGSTEAETLATLERLAADPRVGLLRLADNGGTARALNIGLKQCRAEIVARMDADDIMLPERLARQLAYLRDHPEVDLLGAQMQTFDDATGRVLGRTAHAPVITRDVVRRQVEAGSVWFLNHPTVMFRKASLERIGGYPEQYESVDDLACWFNAYRAGLVIHNLPEILLHYRCHPAQVTYLRTERERRRAPIIQDLIAQWAQYLASDAPPSLAQAPPG